MEVRAIRNKAAGSVEVARGVRKAQEAALEDFPGPVDSRNAAVLEKLEKTGAFAMFVEALEEEKCQTS